MAEDDAAKFVVPCTHPAPARAMIQVHPSSLEPLSTPHRLFTVRPLLRTAALAVGQSTPIQGGTQSMRRAPLALARLSSLSVAATLFLAACGGGPAQPTAAPAAQPTTAPKPAAA